jgi:hypothetical protein
MRCIDLLQRLRFGHCGHHLRGDDEHECHHQFRDQPCHGVLLLQVFLNVFSDF